MSEIDVLLHDVNKNREDGKVLFATIVGVMSANLAEFITQPADGILYDLNRDEVTTASFGITTRTINDLAVATVIRYLRAELARRDDLIKRLKDAGNELYLKGCRNYLPLGDADWAWRALMKELEGE